MNKQETAEMSFFCINGATQSQMKTDPQHPPVPVGSVGLAPDNRSLSGGWEFKPHSSTFF